MADNKHSGGHHLVPFSVYIKTIVALLILTVLTVGASYIDFGKANIVVSLGIATFKASLVLLFFMGLRYDSWLNATVIVSSFAALVLFIGMTAADLWTKKPLEPVKVVAAAGAIGMDDVRVLEKSSPDLVAKGKEIYALNCAVCHGATGAGDGAGGAALNPKPRNFHGPANSWKNGPSVKGIYATLTFGIPGTGMGSYKTLTPTERFALVHFVRSMVPSPPAEAAGDGKYAAALKEDGIGEGAVKKQSIPIDMAIEKLAR
jgi:caa(3)-type oxidase subunit IV